MMHVFILYVLSAGVCIVISVLLVCLYSNSAELVLVLVAIIMANVVYIYL